MKKASYALILLAVLSWSCGGNGRQTERTVSDQHVHELTEEHDHTQHAAGGCDGHDHAAEGHDHAAEIGQPHSPEEIVFTAEQAARTDFEVEEVRLAPFHDVIRCSGEILAAQGDERTLAAPVSGIVTFADAQLSTGARVKSGQQLFYISSRSLASGDAEVLARANFNQAKEAYERTAKLLEDQLVSRKEYEAARSEYLRAKAEYEPYRSSGVRGQAAAAPISGFITGLNVAPGDYVEMGAPLATVSQNRRLQLRAELSQRYYSRMRSIRTATFGNPSCEQVHSLDELNGRLVSVGRNASTGSTLVPVTFEFDNCGGIVQGTFVEVNLIGAVKPEAITLPLSAITEQQGLYYVYVQLDGECYERREVKLGGDDGLRVEILSGVEPGERVVTRGAVNVKMAAASGAIPHGHSH